METMHLRTFQRQALLQCQFMLMAATQVDEALNASVSAGAGQTTRRVFYAVQNLLNAAANISKALWGSGGRLATDRQPMRDSIGISDSSPLREVTMRNHFEHFDERIDWWWANSVRHNYVDLSVGPSGVVSGVDDSDRFRWFDPTTGDVIFWGQSFNLKALIEEVQRILPALQSEAAKPHWDPAHE